MSGPINQNFGEVANLTSQHTALASALQGVFEELIQKVRSTTGEGMNSAAMSIFDEKITARWNSAAQEWANSQGSLAKVIGTHNEDLQATDIGPASNVFNNIAI
jgi:hypothetical protein